ncbi:MAG: sulfatase [Gemmatimonadaceae bacterium]
MRTGVVRTPVRGVLGRLPEVQMRDVLLFAIWIGIIGGFAEAVNAYTRNELRHLPTGDATNGEIFWVVPLAATTGFVAITVGLWVLDRLFGGKVGVIRLAPGILVTLAVYSFVGSLHFGIALYAALVLAVGCAAVFVRLMAARPALVRRVPRVSTPAMVAALVVWGLAVPLWRRAMESRALAALPRAASGTPIVLILIWDTARAFNLSTYGYERETTPELTRFAQRGVVFERAFATAPRSLPSHASMLTGRYPHELSAGHDTPLDDTYPSLASALGEHGYATGGFFANFHYGTPSFGLGRGFSWYDARPTIDIMVIAHHWWLAGTSFKYVRKRFGIQQELFRRHAEHVNHELLRWIERRGDRPFFGFVNYFDAHDPYLPPEPFNLAFSTKQPRYWLDPRPHFYEPEVLRELMTAYDTGIRYLDHELGRLLVRLGELGVLDNTLVIVTSDHGEEFGEHGRDLVDHGRSLYSPVIMVPMVLVYPKRVGAGLRRSENRQHPRHPGDRDGRDRCEQREPFPGDLARSLRGWLGNDRRGNGAALIGGRASL